jgi:hypothetical protein
MDAGWYNGSGATPVAMKWVDGVDAFVIGLSALVLASCVSIADDKYPHDWSAVQASQGTCPDLSGSYVNSGRGTPPVLLAKWILPKTTAPLAQVEQIDLAGPAKGSLTVQLTQGPRTVVAVREWKEGSDYRCESGWLVLQLESIMIPPFGYFKGCPVCAHCRRPAGCRINAVGIRAVTLRPAGAGGSP